MILTLFLFGQLNLYAQKNDNENNPSCQHTKSMLLLAQQQWDSLPYSINTNARSEQFDILHYTVVLNMAAHEKQQIQGWCTINFVPQEANLQELPLDLLQLKVDSVYWKDTLVTFSYNDTLLKVQFGKALPLKTPQQVRVYYRGKPQRDGSWGGFYYQEEYAYNLGVGFASNPHNYGRVWHPCFDNFKERASYTFKITTKGEQRAHCNGYLQSEQTKDNLTTRIWQQKEPIPSYLAAIAVANYTVVEQEYVGVEDTIPIRLVANANDTAALVQSFVHLKQAIAAYEYWFGPHRWQKVGYSLVPFRSGAMEHASNIAYPIFAADGTLKRESLMAHELGHSWWGNLVTCATAKDMWINEGMASYCEQLFVERAYGKDAYVQVVRDNHYSVLATAHQREGGYRPVANVPHKYTYGKHVYDKGAVVAHNLRWYMGDEAFRKGMQAVMKEYAFKNISSGEFRDALMATTGQDLNPFFDDWVFQAGFPHFEVQHYNYKNKTVKVYIAQQLVGRSTYCKQVPLSLKLIGAASEVHYARVWVSGALDSVVVDLPFEPVEIVLNDAQQLNQARFDEVIAIKDSSQTLVNLKYNLLYWEALEILNLGDSAQLHLQRHPVPPSQLPTADYEAAQIGYWTVGGSWNPVFEAEASIRLSKSRLGHLWHKSASADSMVLLYRPHPNSPWQIHPSSRSALFFNSKVLIFKLLKGDYLLAKARPDAMIQEAKGYSKAFIKKTSYQKKQLKIELELEQSQQGCLKLLDQYGTMVYKRHGKWSTRKQVQTIPVQKGGIYFLKLFNKKGHIVFSKQLAL
ncbi:MAG: M1 family metallopeptidase [Aureispira sp.]